MMWAHFWLPHKCSMNFQHYSNIKLMMMDVIEVNWSTCDDKLYIFCLPFPHFSIENYWVPFFFLSCFIMIPRFSTSCVSILDIHICHSAFLFVKYINSFGLNKQLFTEKMMMIWDSVLLFHSVMIWCGLSLIIVSIHLYI